MINVVDVYCRDTFVYCAITNQFFYKTKCQISEKEYGQFIYYDSLNKNTISLKLHNSRGGSRGKGPPAARPPHLKLEKI